MKRHFRQWYSEEVEKRIRSSASNDEKLIDLKLSRLKSLGLKWLIEACSYIETNDFIKNGFQEAGITTVLSTYSNIHKRHLMMKIFIVHN